MARADTARDSGQTEASMLGIYLNDHLAGATAGTELAHRTARSHRDGKNGGTLRRLAAEIAQDRAALLDIMTALGIKVRRCKVSAAWVGEKAGRLKFNGRLLTRSPLSNLEEPEMLRLGVEGKAAGAPCGPWPTPTRASTPRAWTSSSPGPAGRPASSRTSG